MAEFNRFPKPLKFRLRELANFSLKWPNLKVCLLFKLEGPTLQASMSKVAQIIRDFIGIGFLGSTWSMDSSTSI
jgi:hypothetical protein